MLKKNDKMEQPEVEKLQEETGFEIIELDDEMLSDVRGGAAMPQSAQCNCV